MEALLRDEWGRGLKLSGGGGNRAGQGACDCAMGYARVSRSGLI